MYDIINSNSHVNDIKDIVNGITRELKIPDVKYVLHFKNPLNEMAAANGNGQTTCAVIMLNTLWTTDWSQLPTEYRVNDLKDPRLNQRNFYQGLSDHLAKANCLKSRKISYIDIAIFRTFLRMRQDPTKAKLAFRSMIAHELGHIHLNHCEKSEKFCNRAKIAIIVTSVALSILTGIFTAPLILLVGFLFYKFLVLCNTKHHENQADRFAAQRMKDAADGAEYGFNCAKQGFSDMKKCKALTRTEKLFTTFSVIKGNFLPLNFTHGTFGGRIRKMKKHSKAAFGG
ncbi:MAG: M48 family metalloprotease [Chlamydiota bacterium]|nr:M48 family metalloprotease [Chlamydiota bacterium]